MDQPGRGGRLGRGENAGAHARPSPGPGVTPIARAGGKEVYRISFSYRGVQCRETVALPHTRANDVYCLKLLGEIQSQIARGTFDYSEFWPDSARAKVFGHARDSRTIREALEAYRDRSRATLEDSTWRVYRRDIDNVLVPAFGQMRISDIRATDVRDFVGRTEYGLKRLRNLLLPLRAVCDDAVADGILTVNPVGAVKLPRLLPIERRTSTYDANPYTETELVQLLANLPEPERWVFQLWAYTGLRTGELIGLRWSRIDVKAQALTVAETTTLGVDKARAKTAAGIRTFSLLPAALEAIEGMRPHTQLIGDRFARNPRSTLADKSWRENKLASVWAMAHRGTGIAPRNPYQLRHTFASNLLSQGENLARIASMLGHAGTEMVMRNYGRWVGGHALTGGQAPARPYGSEPLWSGTSHVSSTRAAAGT
jgi:integrase